MQTSTITSDEEKSIFSNIVKSGSLNNLQELSMAKDLLTQDQILPKPEVHLVNDMWVDQLKGALAEATSKRVASAIRAAEKQDKLTDAIITVLKKFALSPAQSGLRDPYQVSLLEENLTSLISTGAPLVMALPMGGGKVASTPKAGEHILPDISEWQAWSTLGGIAEAISYFYKPGAQMVAIPDAALHTADLGFPIENVIQHGRQAEQDLKDLGLNQKLLIPNILDHLPHNWAPTLESVLETLSFDSHDRKLVESLQFSINTRVAGLDFGREVLLIAALAGNLSGIPSSLRNEANQFYQRAEMVARHYSSVNLAIRHTNLIGHVVKETTGADDFLRLSVHAKANPIPEIRPALFKTNSLVEHASLLPMHGVGVIEKINDTFKFGITFYLAAIMRGYSKIVWNDRVLGFGNIKDSQ